MVKLKRVPYGKPETPLHKKEYTIEGYGTAVGTLSEIYPILVQMGVSKVEISDPMSVEGILIMSVEDIPDLIIESKKEFEGLIKKKKRVAKERVKEFTGEMKTVTVPLTKYHFIIVDWFERTGKTKEVMTKPLFLDKTVIAQTPTEAILKIKKEIKRVLPKIKKYYPNKRFIGIRGGIARVNPYQYRPYTLDLRKNEVITRLGKKLVMEIQ